MYHVHVYIYADAYDIYIHIYIYIYIYIYRPPNMYVCISQQPLSRLELLCEFVNEGACVTVEMIVRARMHEMVYEHPNT